MILSQEILKRIDSDANYYLGTKGAEFSQSSFDGYTAGATEWAGKTQELADLLDEAHLQIEYLHEKFGETGSGNNVLSRIETALAKYKEVSND